MPEAVGSAAGKFPLTERTWGGRLGDSDQQALQPTVLGRQRRLDRATTATFA